MQASTGIAIGISMQLESLYRSHIVIFSVDYSFNKSVKDAP